FGWTLDPVRESRTIRLDGVAERGAARLHRVTTDVAAAVERNDLLLLIVPAYAHRAFAETCAPYLRPGPVLGLMPGTLGTLEFARILEQAGRPLRSTGVTLAETDTAPYVCRKTAPDAAHIWGVVSGLGVGVLPAGETQRAADLLAPLFTTDGRN